MTLILSDISKRKLFIVIVAIFLCSSLTTNIFYPIRNYYLFTVSGIATILFLISIYYYSTQKILDINKSIYLFLFLTASYLLVYNFPNLNPYLKIGITLTLGAMLYSLLLAFNVYNVSEKFNEDIPLLQPARSVIYMITILLGFMISTVIYKIPIFQNLQVINILIKVLIFFVFYRLLFITSGWYFVVERIGEIREKKMLRLKSVLNFVSLAMFQVSLAVLFLNLEAYASAIIISVGMYISMNYIQHFLSHKIDSRFNIISLMQLIIAVFAAYFIS